MLITLTFTVFYIRDFVIWMSFRNILYSFKNNFRPSFFYCRNIPKRILNCFWYKLYWTLCRCKYTYIHLLSISVCKHFIDFQYSLPIYLSIFHTLTNTHTHRQSVCLSACNNELVHITWCFLVQYEMKKYIQNCYCFHRRASSEGNK